MIWQFTIKEFFPDRADQYHGIAYNTEAKAWFFYKNVGDNVAREWVSPLSPVDALVVAVKSITPASSNNTKGYDVNYHEALVSLLTFAADTCNIAYLYLLILHDFYGRDNPDVWQKIFDCDSKLTITSLNQVNDVAKNALLSFRSTQQLNSDIARRSSIITTTETAAMTQSVHHGSMWQNTLANKDVAGLRRAFAPWQINVISEKWEDIRFIELLKQLMPKVIKQFNEEYGRHVADRNSKNWKAVCRLFTDLAIQVLEQPQWVGHVVKFAEYSSKLFLGGAKEVAYGCIQQMARLRLLPNDEADPRVAEFRDVLLQAYDHFHKDLSSNWRDCLQKALTENDVITVTYLLYRMEITYPNTDTITREWLLQVIKNVPYSHGYFKTVETLWGAVKPMPEWAPLYRCWQALTNQGQNAVSARYISRDTITVIEAASGLARDEQVKLVFDWRDTILKELQEKRDSEKAQGERYARADRVNAMTATELAAAKQALDPYALCRLATNSFANLSAPFDIKHRDQDWFTWMNDAQRDALLLGIAYRLYGCCLTKGTALANLIEWPHYRVRESHYFTEFENSFKPKKQFDADFAVVKAFVALVRIWDYLKFKSQTDNSHQADRQEDFLRLLLQINPAATHATLKRHIDTSGKEVFNARHITIFKRTLVKGSQTYQDLRLDLLRVVASSGMPAMMQASEIFIKNMRATEAINVNSLEAQVLRNTKVPLPTFTDASSSSSTSDQSNVNNAPVAAAPAMAFSSSSYEE